MSTEHRHGTWNASPVHQWHRLEWHRIFAQQHPIMSITRPPVFKISIEWARILRDPTCIKWTMAADITSKCNRTAWLIGIEQLVSVRIRPWFSRHPSLHWPTRILPVRLVLRIPHRVTTLVFTFVINSSRKRKAFGILWADSSLANPVPSITSQCMKVLINRCPPINPNILRLRSLVVREDANVSSDRRTSFSLASSVPADSVGPTDMNESTTGTLLSLGKTEFDRRIKKKWVRFHQCWSTIHVGFFDSDKNYSKMPYRTIDLSPRGMVPLLLHGSRYVSYATGEQSRSWHWSSYGWKCRLGMLLPVERMSNQGRSCPNWMKKKFNDRSASAILCIGWNFA